jgi:tetratricopeptide (TPR) repeat protein
MSRLQMVLRGFVLSLVIYLSACASLTTPDDKPDGKSGAQERQPKSEVVTPPSRAPQTPYKPTGPSASAAWGPLLAKADQAAERGDYEQALALLERAQRIDPNSAEVYLGMAKTHRARGNVAQSRATAERGLLYCTSTAQCDALRSYIR